MTAINLAQKLDSVPERWMMLAGHADSGFRKLSEVSSQIKAGKLTMLAAAVEKRPPDFPDTPTMEEAGVKGLVVYSWQAVAAPKGLPKDVHDKLQGAVVGALKDPEVTQRLEQIGFAVVGNTAPQFVDFLTAKTARWKGVIEKGNIKP
jgi:tripartite-type tricarboxylate transporter receptor subunit TctC